MVGVVNRHITYLPNHWCNESTMISYVQLIIVPYVQETRKNLGLPYQLLSGPWQSTSQNGLRLQITDRSLPHLLHH